jgi:multisubunit Na+/H+ antiporter MnhE subunit
MIARAAGVLALGVLYVLLLPAPTLVDLAIGVALGALVVWAMGPSPVGPRPAGARVRLLALVRLLGWTALDVARGTWRVALAVLGVRAPHHPGVVQVPLEDASDRVLVVMGLLLTISPGSVLVRADLERHELLIHVMDGADADAVRRQQRHLHGLVRAAVGE